MEKIQDAAAELNNKRKKIQLYVIIMLALLVAVAAIGFFYRAAALVAAVFWGVYYFGFLRRQVKSYQGEFIGQTLRYSVCKDCTDVVYDKNKKLLPLLHTCPLFPVDEQATISLWHGFTASCRKHQLAANEMSCNLITEGPKRQLAKGITGTVVSMDVTEEYSAMGPVIVYDRSILEQYIQRVMDKGYQEAENVPEEIDSRRFILLVPKDTQPEWNEKFLQRFALLSSKVDKPFALYLDKGNMIALLSERFYAQEISLKYEVTEKALAGNRLPELQALITFAG